MEQVKRTIENLALMYCTSPFEGYFGAVVDLRGDWDTEVLSRHGDWEQAPKGTVLAIWEGSCTITPDPNDHRFPDYDFQGTWRAPTALEVARLADNRRPFDGQNVEETVRLPGPPDRSPT